MSNIDELQERVRVLESQKSEVVTKIVEKSSNESGEKLLKKIEDLEKKIKSSQEDNKVRAHDAFDNIKFSTDFRTTVDTINLLSSTTYCFRGKDGSGTES